MLIDWIQLLGAVLLLVPPAAAFQGRKIRYLPAGRDWDGHWRWIATVRWHWIDLVRGAVGAWLLLRAASAAPDASGLARLGPTMVHAAVLWPSVLLQTLVRRDLALLHGPFLWISGVAAAFFSPTVSLFAIPLALALTGGLRSAPAYFPLLALSIGALALLLGGLSQAGRVAVLAATALLPTFSALLLAKPLAVTYQRRRSSEPLMPRR